MQHGRPITVARAPRPVNQLLDGNGDIRVNVTHEMEEAASRLAIECDTIAHRVRGPNSASRLIKRSSAYEELLEATHRANPHLEPNNIETYAQTLDLAAAKGGVLNKLIETQAKALGVPLPPTLFATAARGK